MGTRATIHINIDNEYTWSLYKQFDGYPNGLGKNLVHLLKDMRITNGISLSHGEPIIGEIANGAEDAVLQLILGLKNRVGDLYAHRTVTDSDTADMAAGVEYQYTVTFLDPVDLKGCTIPTIGVKSFNDPAESIAECYTLAFLKILETREQTEGM